MNELPKYLSYFIATRVPINSLKYLFCVNKYWSIVGQDSYFWYLKIKYDFPSLFLPYKISNFKNIYYMEHRRYQLLDKFEFVQSFPPANFGEHFDGGSLFDIFDRENELLSYNDKNRTSAILAGMVEWNIYNDEGIVLYGYHNGCKFSISIKDEISYEFEWCCSDNSMDKCKFARDFLELINYSLPKFSPRWTCHNEYFDQINDPLLNSYKSYELEPAKKIIIFKRNDCNDIWIKFLTKFEKKTKKVKGDCYGKIFYLIYKELDDIYYKKVKGNYYGRTFYLVYNGLDEIYLLIDDLLNDQIVDELREILTH